MDILGSDTDANLKTVHKKSNISGELWQAQTGYKGPKPNSNTIISTWTAGAHSNSYKNIENTHFIDQILSNTAVNPKSRDFFHPEESFLIRDSIETQKIATDGIKARYPISRGQGIQRPITSQFNRFIQRVDLNKNLPLRGNLKRMEASYGIRPNDKVRTAVRYTGQRQIENDVHKSSDVNVLNHSGVKVPPPPIHTWFVNKGKFGHNGSNFKRSKVFRINYRKTALPPISRNHLSQRPLRTPFDKNDKKVVVDSFLKSDILSNGNVADALYDRKKILKDNKTSKSAKNKNEKRAKEKWEPVFNNFLSKTLDAKFLTDALDEVSQTISGNVLFLIFTKTVTTGRLEMIMETISLLIYYFTTSNRSIYTKYDVRTI